MMCEASGAGALEVLSAVRRYLEDLVAFEGPDGRFPLGEITSAAAGSSAPAPEAPAAKPPLPPCPTRADAAGVGPCGSPGSVPSAVEAPAEDGSPAALEALRKRIEACALCGLAATRRRAVVGAGDLRAGLLFIGEAPGEEEDRQGEPFVGPAGQLLTRIIQAMGLTREQVYITNILKCRPPGNRDPREDEVAACEPHLKAQLDLIRPRIICTLGRIAAQALLRTPAPLGQLRGRTHEYAGIPVICTYHPAALLRKPEYKRPTWEDVKRLRAVYDGVQL